MKKLNIIQITYIPIDCPHCDKAFYVFINKDWNDIKQMKVGNDKRLMLSCPYCDHIYIENTNFSSVCFDKDEYESLEMTINGDTLEKFKEIADKIIAEKCKH